MTLLAGSPDIDTSLPVLPDASSRAPDREREPRNQAWAPPGEFCLRCGGLLVTGYLSSLERDVTGRPMRLWRFVNCGDRVDCHILANRGKGPVPARPRARLKNGVIEVRMPKTDEAKKKVITVTIDCVFLSRVSSPERSTRHGQRLFTISRTSHRNNETAWRDTNGSQTSHAI
jgi:hypothetical protein